MTTSASHPPRLTAWAQLLRLPNLFTVPGDPLAGFVLAATAGATAGNMPLRLAAAMGASVLLYCAGLLQNDYFDLAEDRRDRPDRPLPSGALGPRTVIVVAFVLAGLGVVASRLVNLPAGIAAGTLVVAMTAYNVGVKRVAVLGPVVMGLCRALSLLIGSATLGWAAISAPAVVASACFLAAYIAAVTHIAARETQQVDLGPYRHAPQVIVAAWFVALYALRAPQGLVELLTSAALAALVLAWLGHCTSALKGLAPPAVVQRTVGRLVAALPLIQAGIVVFIQPIGLLAAAALLAAWVAARRLARRFYAS